MRDILIADGLLSPEVECILRTENARIEAREYWETAISVGERFGERIRRQKIESISEPALGLD